LQMEHENGVDHSHLTRISDVNPLSVRRGHLVRGRGRGHARFRMGDIRGALDNVGIARLLAEQASDMAVTKRVRDGAADLLPLKSVTYWSDFLRAFENDRSVSSEATLEIFPVRKSGVQRMLGSVGCNAEDGRVKERLVVTAVVLEGSSLQEVENAIRGVLGGVLVNQFDGGRRKAPPEEASFTTRGAREEDRLFKGEIVGHVLGSLHLVAGIDVFNATDGLGDKREGAVREHAGAIASSVAIVAISFGQEFGFVGGAVSGEAFLDAEDGPAKDLVGKEVDRTKLRSAKNAGPNHLDELVGVGAHDAADARQGLEKVLDAAAGTEDSWVTGAACVSVESEEGCDISNALEVAFRTSVSELDVNTDNVTATRERGFGELVAFKARQVNADSNRVRKARRGREKRAKYGFADGSHDFGENIEVAARLAKGDGFIGLSNDVALEVDGAFVKSFEEVIEGFWKAGVGSSGCTQPFW
jgi:hypothetical protein